MSKFAFSSATIGSTSITTAEFVYGRGLFEEYGWDVQNNVANGFVHVDRVTQLGRGRMTLYGNRESLAHPAAIPSLSYAIVLTSADGDSKIRTGVITKASYRDKDQVTVVDFTTDPIPPCT